MANSFCISPNGGDTGNKTETTNTPGSVVICPNKKMKKKILCGCLQEQPGVVKSE
jgi:hypothetical protein